MPGPELGHKTHFWTERNTHQKMKKDMAGSEAENLSQPPSTTPGDKQLNLAKLLPLPEIHGTEVPTLSDHWKH